MKQFGLFAVMAVFLAACSEGPSSSNIQAPTATLSTRAVSSLEQVNAIRAEAGLSRVTRSRLLDQAALAHARDMKANNFMGHTGSDGSDLRVRVERAGYRWCALAENVSRGYQSDARAIEAWRTSPGHYRNLVKPKVRDVGMANVDGFHVMVLGASGC